MNKLSWWVELTITLYLIVSMVWAMIGRAFLTFYTPPLAISIGSLIGTLIGVVLLLRLLFMKG